MKFERVAQQFELIEKESSRLAMTQLLADLFKQSTVEEIEIICNLSLGILRPVYLGNQFKFAEKSLINVVAIALDKSIAEITQKTKEVGDLGQVFTDGKQEQDAIIEQMTVVQVYEMLTKLEQISGSGSQEEKTHLLVNLLQQLAPISGKYVLRIIMGTLRLGFSDMTIIDALSWMAVGNKSMRATIEDAYNVCADIGLIAKTLKKDGIDAIRAMRIHVGIPIRPAAAERLPTAQDIIKKLGPCIAQPKLDGFRIQIHIDKSKKIPSIEFFSRNLIDMSAMFPDLVEALQQLAVQTLIVEGEAISYDQNTNSFLPFQETVKRKRKYDIEETAAEFPLRVYLFDLLYLNGKEYLSTTHEERRATLRNLLVKTTDQRVQLIDEVALSDADQLQIYFNQQMDMGLEGIVVKKPNSTYQPGKRNFNWIKFKRQEEGHLEDTLDCVILGYYAGSGKRAQFGVGAFLVGIFNKAQDRFETIAKIGTGLKDDEWKELKQKCDAIKIDHHPKNIICPKELAPDVWVNPHIVCMVRADEITMSPLHTAGKNAHQLGYALRFPRFMGYRFDKGAEESTTIDEVKRLYQNQFSKNN